MFHWGRFALTPKFSSSSRNWLSCHYVALELVQLCLLLRLLFLLLSRRQRVREEEGYRGVVVSGLTHDGLARSGTPEHGHAMCSTLAGGPGASASCTGHIPAGGGLCPRRASFVPSSSSRSSGLVTTSSTADGPALR